ncbi:Glucose/ribitol dehydrogenase [Artemisia annua]|uniref:Glucose/ribitol dehydrogenase n=1 Tax=Artemisia annua TaxID=35608 RepID=A0A2U1P4Q1_ARTAN|nr:Glucose/ribitol dehydrogenase [Artemisia annua]
MVTLKQPTVMLSEGLICNKLTLAFLAIDMFFAAIGILLSFLVGVALCFFFPCIIGIMYIIDRQEGASDADINILPKYVYVLSNDEEQPDVILSRMVPVGTNSPDFNVERFLLNEDAVSQLPMKFFLELENKVAIVTGGARGIGECIVRLFVKHGAKVVIADIIDDLGELVCQDLGAEFASFIHCDVTIESDIENLINTTIAKHGKLDIMVNNAGIIDEPKLSILDNDKSDFERVVSVNLTGVFLGTKHAARVMIPKCSGSIITTASICSVIGGVASHAYTSSKHAVVGLAKNAAAELGNSSVYSNLNGKTLGPQDIANAALFLASDESEYVSGHNLVVDGGYSVLNPAFGLFSWKPLENKVAIVTGGARGIGECIVRLFVKHGAKVVIADIIDDLGELVCQDLGAEFASFIHCDELEFCSSHMSVAQLVMELRSGDNIVFVDSIMYFKAIRDFETEKLANLQLFLEASAAHLGRRRQFLARFNAM